MPGGRRHSDRDDTRQHQFRLKMRQQVPDAYVHLVRLGRALLLGLELLVAADIIRTVALEPTLPNVMILAVLVVVRIPELVADRGDGRALAVEGLIARGI